MATARRTTDHDQIRDWVESKGGHPALVEGTGVLRVDFGEPEQSLQRVSWTRFFEVFDRSNIAFLYDPQGHMVKFVEEDRMAARNGRRKGARKTTRKKSSSNGRKKTSARGRKKSSTRGRKKTSTGGRKKSSTRGRKKTSTGERKKASTRGRKKSSTGGRKKSSGRKYGRKAGRKVERAMHEMKRGELKSGRSGKKVKSRKQAIAIGLSEARRGGAKVPPNPNRRKKR